MSLRTPRFVASAVGLGLLASIGTASLAAAQTAQPAPATVQIGAGREQATATGSVTLTAVGNQTRVEVNVAGTNPVMPGHIHSDTCPGAGPVLYPLQNVMSGKSTTMIDTPLSEVLAKGKSINFHKSPQEAGVYTGCGNIQVAGVQAGQPSTLPRTGDLGAIAPLLGAAGAGLAGVGLLLRRRFSR